jgi:hypothetical protein
MDALIMRARINTSAWVYGLRFGHWEMKGQLAGSNGEIDIMEFYSAKAIG